MKREEHGDILHTPSASAASPRPATLGTGPSPHPIRLGIVAGEASGDLLGAHLIRGLQRHRDPVRAVGIAGGQMQAAGAKSLHPMEKLSVRGYSEVFRHLPELIRIRRSLRDGLLADPPDLFVGVDAPDFNFGLERALKKKGIPTVHLASPSIWAWRGRRIRKIRRAVSLMLVLFPFEEEIYRQAGIPVAYVGHPLADMLPLEPDTAAARDQLRLPKNGPIIALLPGSQEGEVGQLGEIFIRAAQLMQEKLPDCRFLVPLVSRETRMLFEAARYNADATELPMTVMIGHSRLAMQAADAVLVASGTATLEAALLKKPMVISYRLKPFSAFLVRRKLKVPYVGLPNILAGRRLVPELLQEDATPDKLAAAMLDLLADEAAQAEMMTAFAEMHRQLRQNCGEKAAQAILSLLGTAK